ncbi:MAG TPA: RNA polymerase sigma factor [Chitinophagaceae bacterium]|nr:RNA polymerase sigma factor [Chitinophagaceae bacterium]
MTNQNENIYLLLNGCRSNNRHSQQQMYELLKDYAMRICFRYLTTHEEAEEVMNEGFVKLFKHIHQFEENRHDQVMAALKGWFRRILVNTCIDQLRKTSSFLNGHTLKEAHEYIADVGESGLDRISYKEIIASVKQLSPAYRTVFNLFVIEGLSHEEISKQLGISVGSSKSNLSKARENLRKILIKKTDPELQYVEARR